MKLDIKGLLPSRKNKEEPSDTHFADGPEKASPGLVNKPTPFLVAGLLLVIAPLVLMNSDREERAEAEMAVGSDMVSSIFSAVTELRGLLESNQLTQLALTALEDPEQTPELQQYISEQLPETKSVVLLEAEHYITRTDLSQENGFVLMDLLMEAESQEFARVQSFDDSGERVIATARVLRHTSDELPLEDAEERPTEPVAEPIGFLVLKMNLEFVTHPFAEVAPGDMFIALQQRNGRFGSTVLAESNAQLRTSENPRVLNVPSSRLSVVLPGIPSPSALQGLLKVLAIALGALCIVYGAMRWVLVRRLKTSLEPDANGDEAAEALEFSGFTEAQVDHTQEYDSEPGSLESNAPQEPDLTVSTVPESSASLSDVEPGTDHAEAPSDMDPVVHLEADAFADDGRGARSEEKKSDESEAGGLALKQEIFRAYDIRGIVGETLDRGVARQVGQAIGAAALEENADPVVVGRDGRHSGPSLSRGMIEGIASTGCDVVDVGAVPTGALYFMANVIDSGSGVMITGSHNPPEYNGFKVMIGGETLAGDRITALFHRLQAGNLPVGQGSVTQVSVLERYRERIAGDIQLQRPIRVVADCGNGIGGACATDILQAIGADVLPLYDEVDGDFPNHHPDPSEPENLNDLIEMVNLTNADLGVAFDGDADRLGVVTPSGEIVFADRVMMLYVAEILGRNPGAPIIYDVKCTGALAQVISESGGEPEMYKTGHSLIKNRMKQVGAPFAGEMSGHFFFADRWYGFDCGIYSACRLLEILALDERTPKEVLSGLPNSISTPELKVHMQEGENHAFVKRFQDEAVFPGASVSTIDGLRADFEAGWGLCRASNTTPILVVRFDAQSEEALATIKEAFRAQMLAIEPELDLPF